LWQNKKKSLHISPLAGREVRTGLRPPPRKTDAVDPFVRPGDILAHAPGDDVERDLILGLLSLFAAPLLSWVPRGRVPDAESYILWKSHPTASLFRKGGWLR